MAMLAAHKLGSVHDTPFYAYSSIIYIRFVRHDLNEYDRRNNRVTITDHANNHLTLEKLSYLHPLSIFYKLQGGAPVDWDLTRDEHWTAGEVIVNARMSSVSTDEFKLIGIEDIRRSRPYNKPTDEAILVPNLQAGLIL